MAIIDPEGLFRGDRMRSCSNTAQLHWPRLFLASDGFGRIEINYARIVGRAYATFNPIPSEMELQQWFQEYAKNFLIFPYGAAGQLWGQWDTPTEFLPRYKTALDRRSPIPPEPAFTEWKRKYRNENKSFPKCFQNISESFLYGGGVGVGVGKNPCSTDVERVGVFDSQSNEADLDRTTPKPQPKIKDGLTSEQEVWFTEFWQQYWRRQSKKDARAAFQKHVRNVERFALVMQAIQAQRAEMLTRDVSKRPHGATWLNGERWTDEPAPPMQIQPAGESQYTTWEPPEAVHNA